MKSRLRIAPNHQEDKPETKVSKVTQNPVFLEFCWILEVVWSPSRLLATFQLLLTDLLATALLEVGTCVPVHLHQLAPLRVVLMNFPQLVLGIAGFQWIFNWVNSLDPRILHQDMEKVQGMRDASGKK